MGSPRGNYRAVCVLIPAATVLAVVAVVAGEWLMLACMCFAILGGVLNLRQMRRRGYDWSWPASYRDMRAGRPSDEGR